MQDAGMDKVVGQTKDVGFEIGVSRIVPHPIDEVWAFLTGEGGVAIWLGPGAKLPPEKRSTYETDDGTTGEVRGYRERDRVRLTWRPAAWDHDTTMQFTVSPVGSRTLVRFHQEWLADADERERQRAHWRDVMDRVEAALAPPDGLESAG